MFRRIVAGVIGGNLRCAQKRDSGLHIRHFARFEVESPSGAAKRTVAQQHAGLLGIPVMRSLRGLPLLARTEGQVQSTKDDSKFSGSDELF